MNDDILNGREMPEEEQEKFKEKIVDVDEDKLKFYEDLRKKAKGWTQQKGGSIGGKLGEYLFLLPDFFILVCRLAMDKRVPTKQKLMAGGIVAYVIMPLDIIPDFIPIIGHVDDLVLVVMGLNMILNEIDAKILADNWSGEGEVLDQMKKITATAEQFLDKNILQKIKGWLKR
ncbi:MAG: DUF1232 domain-containing protein [Candidatus Cloacimonetes bacterium]|nr:DUF1232 domain-containing protein [Candidatus Cloacimonadota bacterium]